MVTHREEWRVRTSIYVTPCKQHGAAWEVCAGAAGLLADARVRECGDLSPILETQGGIVVQALAGVVRHVALRLVARETTSRGLVGLAEWQHDPESGLWRMHCPPWTVCDAGQHRPGGPALGVAA
ncbi:hypothetical protein [Kitasatospora sp. NPDC001527]|uniref:hypothetical protein n=1 Tax=Kitasatospora sp. NPDC001527 TaxID=3154519 RepID=UPI003317F47E